MSRCSEWERVDQRYRDVIEKFQKEPQVRVGALARELGIEIKVANLDPGQSGSISRNGDGYIVKVNRFEAKERQRYTIAHELAHYLLHRDIIDRSEDGIVDTVLYRSGAAENIEYEANRLAADILMPRENVASRLHEMGGKVTEGVIALLAEEFRVSRAAMEIRLGHVV